MQERILNLAVHLMDPVAAACSVSWAFLGVEMVYINTYIKSDALPK